MDARTVVQAIVGESEWDVAFNAQPDDYRRAITFERQRSSVDADTVRVVPVYDSESGSFTEYVIKTVAGGEETIIDTADKKVEAIEIAREKINET